MAAALQEICYEAWTHDPQKVASVVDVLDELATVSGEKVVSAYASWARGISCLVDGRLESAIERINESEAVFMSLEMTGLAAGTQTGKLYALAMLGRYEEAVQCGVSAREIFVEHNDQYSAGKIEHNIGNLFWRRDLYRESEPFLESAHQRFTLIGDQRQLAMVENCQAFVHSLQNRFRDAERLYSQALTRAESLGLTVTAAEIETGLSNLYLLEGKYDLALKYMECSRQKYDSLGMPAQSVNCELEIADIYLELNLLNEATACYGRCEKNYTELGMQAELARCLKNQAVALFVPDKSQRRSRNWNSLKCFLIEKAMTYRWRRSIWPKQRSNLILANLNWPKLMSRRLLTRFVAVRIFGSNLMPVGYWARSCDLPGEMPNHSLNCKIRFRRQPETQGRSSTFAERR
ncbi:MAG: tetratricopeptide repeat protein [Chloracidobacterium sp.]|nr:tetratricopeptide repeat protein [Chloracidobacterium sp.]